LANESSSCSSTWPLSLSKARFAAEVAVLEAAVDVVVIIGSSDMAVETEEARASAELPPPALTDAEPDDEPTPGPPPNEDEATVELVEHGPKLLDPPVPLSG
jgi:hypothetical protein